MAFAFDFIGYQTQKREYDGLYCSFLVLSVTNFKSFLVLLLKKKKKKLF